VIEHTRVGLCFFACFLFEADTQLGFLTLARCSLVFFADSPFFRLQRFLFSSKPGSFVFCSLLGLGGDTLALGCLALKPLVFFATDAVLLDAHELAKIEEK
jgi:hypothetical protein